MADNNKMESFEIIKHLRTLSKNEFGNKELNLISWKGGEPQFDIRTWNNDYTNMTRGIILNLEQMYRLYSAFFRRQHLRGLTPEKKAAREEYLQRQDLRVTYDKDAAAAAFGNDFVDGKAPNIIKHNKLDFVGEARGFENTKDNMTTFRIEEHIAILEHYPSGWTKELNVVAWNGNEPKFDIRDWDPEHSYMSKGISLTGDEMHLACIAVHSLSNNKYQSHITQKAQRKKDLEEEL